MSRVRVKFSELLDAFKYVSAGSPFEHSAYLNLDTGQFHWHSDFGDNEEELPDDIDDENRYIDIPHKNDLDLGARLVFKFVADYLPEDLEAVRNIFRRRGAYSRYKDLLARRRMLDQWYAFENEETAKALGEWSRLNGISTDA